MDEFRQILVEDYRRIYRESLRKICGWKSMIGRYPDDNNNYKEAIHGFLLVARSARRALRDMGEEVNGYRRRY